MRKRYSRSYTVLSFLTMFSYRELPLGWSCFLECTASRGSKGHERSEKNVPGARFGARVCVAPEQDMQAIRGGTAKRLLGL